MRVQLGGAEGLLREGSGIGFATALIDVLERCGHETCLLETGPVEGCGLFVAFVDHLSLELLQAIQTVVECDIPVLCLTDGRVPIEADCLVVANRLQLIDVARYRNFDDMASRVLKYLSSKGQSRKGRALNS